MCTQEKRETVEDDEIQSCLVLKILRGTKQNHLLVSPQKAPEVSTEPGFADCSYSPLVWRPWPSGDLVQWQTAGRRGLQVHAEPAVPGNLPEGRSCSSMRERSRTGLTLIPKCSVTPRPCSPRTPNERLSSRKILALYLYFNLT